jgi:glutaredoxin-related protein
MYSTTTLSSYWVQTSFPPMIHVYQELTYTKMYSTQEGQLLKKDYHVLLKAAYPKAEFSTKLLASLTAYDECRKVITFLDNVGIIGNSCPLNSDSFITIGSLINFEHYSKNLKLQLEVFKDTDSSQYLVYYSQYTTLPSVLHLRFRFNGLYLILNNSFTTGELKRMLDKKRVDLENILGGSIETIDLIINLKI